MSIEEFNGKVYCVEVKPYHTVLAGRSNKLNFCGQSFFGSLASPMCRFFNLEIGNAITHFGQHIVKTAAIEIEKKGYIVIYQDTDSCFVISKKTSLEDAEKEGKDLEKYLNSFFKEYIKKEYNLHSYLELEYERCFTRFLMPKLRHGELGAKKRYAGLIIKEGKEEIKFTGLESVRLDWTEAAKIFQYELLNHIFHKQEVSSYIKKFVEDVKDGKHDNLLIYKKSVRKDLEKYTATTPPHVKAARQLKELETNIVEYVITTNGPEPIQNQKHKIDYNHYIDKQIKPIADSILVFFNKTFDEVISGDKQSSLFKFS